MVRILLSNDQPKQPAQLALRMFMKVNKFKF